MNILFAIGSLKAGGAERQLVQFLSELQKDKLFSIELVCLDTETQFEEINNFQFKVHYITRAGSVNFKIYRKLNHIIKNFKPDVVHSWDTLSTFYLLPFRIFSLNIKLIDGSIRSAMPTAHSNFATRLLRAINFRIVDRIISNSKAGLINNNIKNKKALVIYNGIKIERFNNLPDVNSIKTELNIGNEIIIGIVSNFTVYKDYKSFFMLANELLKSFSNIKFVIVGYGNKMDYYKNRIIPENRDKYIFLGRQTEVERIINIFDIAVLTTFYEGIPNAVMEYMALSKPVVVSGEGGVSELIVDGQSGFLLEPEDVEGLQSRISNLIENKKTRENLGLNAFKRISQDFSFLKFYKKNINLYKSLKK